MSSKITLKNLQDQEFSIVHPDGAGAISIDSNKIMTKVASTDNALVRFDGTTGAVQNSSVVVDDNGNVGIGTSTNYAKLTVRAYDEHTVTVDGASVSKSAHLTATAGSRSIGFGASASKETNYIGSLDAGHKLNFFTYNGSEYKTVASLTNTGNLLVGTTTDNGVDKLQVNGSISVNGQPIISGQIGTAIINPTGAQVLKFNEFWVNQGGIIYNTSTGTFTITSAGIYRITFNPFFAAGQGASRVLIGKNTLSPTVTNHIGHSYRESSTYDTGNLNSVVSLAANDYIVFYLSSGGLYNQAGDLFNQFSIEKIA